MGFAASGGAPRKAERGRGVRAVSVIVAAMRRCAVACRDGRSASGAQGIKVVRPRPILTRTCTSFPEGRDTSGVRRIRVRLMFCCCRCSPSSVLRPGPPAPHFGRSEPIHPPRRRFTGEMANHPVGCAATPPWKGGTTPSASRPPRLGKAEPPRPLRGHPSLERRGRYIFISLPR